MPPIFKEDMDSSSKVLLLEGWNDERVVNSVIHRFDQGIHHSV